MKYEIFLTVVGFSVCLKLNQFGYSSDGPCIKNKWIITLYLLCNSADVQLWQAFWVVIRTVFTGWTTTNSWKRSRTSKWCTWTATRAETNRRCITRGPGRCAFTRALGREEWRPEDAGTIQVRQCGPNDQKATCVRTRRYYCMRFSFYVSETFHINPQLHLILSEMEEVVISLNQHSIMEPKVIGFTAYSLPKSCMDSTGKEFFKKNKSLVNSQYTNSRQVPI